MPLIPVHHIRGHIAANYLAFPELEPPFLALAISGGNTMIVDVRDYTDMEILAPPGMTQQGSASTRRPGCWACLSRRRPHGRPGPAVPGRVYTLPHAQWTGQSWT